jgi:hypothetical protein
MTEQAMTPQRLAEIKRWAIDNTNVEWGPWWIVGDPRIHAGIDDAEFQLEAPANGGTISLLFSAHIFDPGATAVFIAESRVAVPELIREVERLQKKVRLLNCQKQTAPPPMAAASERSRAKTINELMEDICGFMGLSEQGFMAQRLRSILEARFP